LAVQPSPPEPASTELAGNPYVASLLAWLVPGGGHLYLRRWARGGAFLAIVVLATFVGTSLDGRLFRFTPGQPLSYLGTVGEMGLGLLYFVLRLGLGYEGTLSAPGYEYGSAFLLTAALMNLLLILDAWDIAHGKKP